MTTVKARRQASRWLSEGLDSDRLLKPGLLYWLSAMFVAALNAPVYAQYGSTIPGTGIGGGGAPARLGNAQGDDGVPVSGKRGLEIHPTLSVTETYTDNLRLAPDGLARGDWVTTLRPGVSVTGNGARARFNVNYSPEILYRAQEGTQDIYHYLDAKGDTELVQKLLYFDARAAVTQQNISLFGPQAESNVNNTGNRTSVKMYSLSPYLRHDFGYDAQGELRLTHNAVSSSGNSATDSEANRMDMRLSSGSAFKLLTWNLKYHKEQIKYTQTGQEDENQSISATARRLIIPTLGLRATVGYEDNQYVTNGPAPQGAFWSVGPEWNPSPRTRFAATVGRRYFGPTSSLDFSHRTRLTTWSAEYSEDITTSRADILMPTTLDTAGYLDTLYLSSIPDPVARQAAVQNFINQSGLPPTLAGAPVNIASTSTFLQKRWRASFGILGVRNTVLASVFSMTREALGVNQPGAGDFALSSSTKQTGADLAWSLRLAAQSTANASVGYTRNEFIALGREDRLTFVRVGLTRQFDPRLFGTVNYSRLENTSNQGGTGYKENAVSAALTMRF